MNEYLVYFLIGLGILLVSLIIPGLKVIAEAVFKLTFEFLTEILKHKGTFVVWAIKTLTADHGRVFQHAITKQDTLDPTQRIRRQAEGYDT